MALQYGMNILASDVRKILERNDRQQSGVRTWQQLFGNASLGASAQSDALKSSYSDAMAQAYRASLGQQNAPYTSDLSAGSMRKVASTNNRALHQTYQQYMQGFNEGAAAIGENYQQEIGAIDAALTERAQNFSKLYGSAYKYLSDQLSKGTMSRDIIDKPIYDDEGVFQGYEQEAVDYLREHNLDWLRDADGNLLSWNAASQLMLNPDGSFNAKGIEFFDNMFNAMPQGYLNEEGNAIQGFDEWLTGEDSDLRDWAIAQDAFNYSRAGSNLGTSKVNLGMESTDFTVAPYEYLDPTNVTEIVNGIESLSFAAKREDTLYRQRYTDWQKIKDSGEQAYEAPPQYKAIEAWKNYQTDLANKKAPILEKLKRTLGTALYNDFIAREISFENEYETLLTDMAKTETYDEKLVQKMNAWYTQFTKRIQNYVRAHSYNGVITGY